MKTEKLNRFSGPAALHVSIALNLIWWSIYLGSRAMVVSTWLGFTSFV